MKLACYIASAFLFIFGILAWLNIQKWYIKIFDFGKFQLCILILLLMLLYGLFIQEYSLLDIIILSGLLLVLGLNFSVIIPFTPLWKKEITASSNNGETIGLLISNVRQKNKQTHRLKNLIREKKPDIILLTEVDQQWCSALEDVVSYLPYRIMQPQDNTYGMAFYSRFSLKNEKVNFYIEDDVPSVRCMIRINDHEYINFFGLHPKPPAPWTKLLHKQAEIILVSRLIEELEDPTIVAGDLNDVGWSKITSIFKKISGLVDPRIGRGFYNTYNANIPFFRYPVDHLFLSDIFKLTTLDRLGHIGSDHFPIYVKVTYEPGNRKKAREQKDSVSATVFAKKAEDKQL